jgi:hypothetical protein
MKAFGVSVLGSWSLASDERFGTDISEKASWDFFVNRRKSSFFF